MTMKRSLDWKITIALVLVGLSAFFYGVDYLIFRDARHIFLYFIGDIAFLFLDVLIVMLVVHGLLEYREKQSLYKKLNMVIGTFFTEVGTELLKRFAQLDPDLDVLAKELVITKEWSKNEFARVRKDAQSHKACIDGKRGDLLEMKHFLVGKRSFLLNLLENQNLLEHESFTNLLWAVFHLTDELAHRKDLKSLPETDYEHLSGDMKRAYQQLILQWLDYMKHLKEDYPYLFSLAMRTNPFDSYASVEVRS
jgi:hypothetical protein